MTKYLNISTDTTLGGNSPADDVVVSQKAIKTYVDNQGGGGTTYTAGTGIDITNDVISVKTPTLTNLTTQTNSLSVGGTATTKQRSTNLGVSSDAYGQRSVAVGYNSWSNAYGVAIGDNMVANTGSVALGYAGTQDSNAEAGVFTVSLVKNYTTTKYKVLDDSGLIPAARHADTTSAAQGQVLTLDSNLKPQWAAGGGGGDIDCGTMS